MKSFAEYYQLYRDARDFDTTRFDDYLELMAFYEGKQNLLYNYSGEKPWVIDINTPYATDAINTRVASLLSNDYVGEILPLSPYDSDKVFKLNMAYHNLWNELNMDNHVNESIKRCSVVREAYTHIVYNDDIIYGGTNAQRKGKLEAYFIDPAAIYIDPNALSLKTADYVVIVERITVNEASSRYKKFDAEMSRSSMFTFQDRGEEWAGSENAFQDDGLLTKMTFYEVEDRGMPSQTIYKTVFVENQMVYKTAELPIKYLPIAQLRWEKKMKSPYGISLMDRLLPLQKTVNAIESASTNTALSFAVPSFIVSKDSGLDPMDVARTAGAPGMVYPVEGAIDQAIRPLMEGKVLDQEMMVMKQEVQSNIYQIAGVTPQFVGQLGTAGNTTGGANQAISRAKVIEQNFIVNLEEYIEDLTNVVVDFLVKVFAGEKLYSRAQAQQNGQYKFNEVQVPATDQDFEYEFYVDLDVRTPYNKENIKELMLQLYQFERQYDAPVKVVSVVDVLKTYNIPNREELVNRYEQMLSQSSQKKAELIVELTAQSIQLGIQEQALNQAISEIISGKETPTLDYVMKQIQQAKQQMQQQAQQQQAQMGMQQQAAPAGLPAEGQPMM